MGNKTSGTEMVHIITKLPATVTRLVTMCTTSVDRLTVTTSMSYDTREMMSPA